MSKASEEAQKQLDRIVALGYPDVADMSAAAFRALARPIIRALEDSDLGTQILLVPTRELVSPESLIARTSINRMAGFTTMPPRDIASFLPQDGFEPPEGPFYLVIEPHTGTCYINREPDVARKLIDSDERLPLTLEEGLAIATQHPEWLLEKNGFNLPRKESGHNANHSPEFDSKDLGLPLSVAPVPTIRKVSALCASPFGVICVARSVSSQLPAIIKIACGA